LALVFTPFRKKPRSRGGRKISQKKKGRKKSCAKGGKKVNKPPLQPKGHNLGVVEYDDLN